MTGPEFLVFYSVWLTLTLVGVLELRKHGYDSPLITLGGLFAFWSLGLIRIYEGYRLGGMRHWEFLAILMLGGALLFIMRVERKGGGDGGGGCSSAGGCGGGCDSGCGGGCGGCGGS